MERNDGKKNPKGRRDWEENIRSKLITEHFRFPFRFVNRCIMLFHSKKNHISYFHTITLPPQWEIDLLYYLITQKKFKIRYANIKPNQLSDHWDCSHILEHKLQPHLFLLEIRLVTLIYHPSHFPLSSSYHLSLYRGSWNFFFIQYLTSHKQVERVGVLSDDNMPAFSTFFPARISLSRSRPLLFVG